MAEFNHQHNWKKVTLFAPEFQRDMVPLYVAPSSLAAAADRVSALGSATAFATTKVIPANTLAVGDIIEVQATCNHVEQNITDTQALALNLGSTQVAASAAMSLAANGGQGVYVRGVVIAIGASGVIAFFGQGGSMNGAGTAADGGQALVLSVDTTAAQTFTVVATHSANSASNKSDLRQFDMRINRPGGNGIDATPVFGSVNALGIPGILMNTDGERIRRLYQIADVTTAAEVFARVLWTTGSTTSADTVLWKVSVKVQTAEEALTVTSPTTLSLTDNATGSAYEFLVSPADKFAAGVIDNMDTFVVEVEMDTKAVGLAEPIYFLGLELLYLPATVADHGLAAPPLPSGWPGT